VDDVILAHWYSRFDTFSYSTAEFYDAFYQAIVKREMPDVSLRRPYYPESNVLSARREYFEVARGKHVLVLCAAPFGIDYFVSWWLLEKPGCLGGCLTALLPILAVFARRTTFYEEDTAIIFRDAVHQAVMETIDGIFKSKEMVFEGERKPVSRTRLL
jgi:hypothetical protein